MVNKKFLNILTAAVLITALSGCSSGKTVYPLPTEAEDAEVYVEPIGGLSQDFIRGVDISSVLAQEKSGVVYYNADGKEQDIFQTLAENGVNYVRVRVWNDPHDDSGNGYGGGNCDTDAAAQIGKRAAKYGMKLCVDYHYSDFWADPNKQMCPKAWKDYDIDQKVEALGKFTEESLKQIIKAGADVGMVQIGNEINNGMSGEVNWGPKAKLLKAGCAAVRKVAEEKKKEIKIAMHFTNITDREQIHFSATKLKDHDMDYDVFAVSYYPFWHGTVENLTDVLKDVASTYGKEVLVAENSYVYTAQDGDGSGNSVSGEEPSQGYAVSEQGQTNEIRDVCAAIAAVGDAGLGYFYWEPAWIPVGVYDGSDAVLSANKEKWEKNGSGWASSFAAQYDPDDAGKYYGGSSWDNQALFDFTGHPLESLKTFKYLYCGTKVEKKLESVAASEVNVDLNGVLDMPQTVTASFNDRTTQEWQVAWDSDMIAAVDTSNGADYRVDGTVTPADGFTYSDKITAVVHVLRQNRLKNASFEEDDISMWSFDSEESGVPDLQRKVDDAYSGEVALHFWSKNPVNFTAKQEITGLEPGTYECGVYIQGGDVGDAAAIYLYADSASGHAEAPASVSGWRDWKNPSLEMEVGEDGTLTIGASVSCAAGGWGTLDDFYVYKIK